MPMLADNLPNYMKPNLAWMSKEAHDPGTALTLLKSALMTRQQTIRMTRRMVTQKKPGDILGNSVIDAFIFGTANSKTIKENMIPPKTYVINKKSPVLADLFKIETQTKKKSNKIASSREPAVKRQITRAKLQSYLNMRYKGQVG